MLTPNPISTQAQFSHAMQTTQAMEQTKSDTPGISRTALIISTFTDEEPTASAGLALGQTPWSR